MSMPDPRVSAPIVPRVLVTDQLLREYMAEQMNAGQKTFDGREFRLSEAGGCPRLRVAKALGLVGNDAVAHTPDDFDHVSAGHFERGRIAERWLVDRFRERYPRRCRTQVEIRHPYGSGHADLYFPAERLLVEMKAPASFDSPTPKDSHVMQLQAYLHFYRDRNSNRKADRGELVYVYMSGVSMTWKVYPVLYRPEVGERIEQDLHDLAAHRDRGVLPKVPVWASPFAFPCYWQNKRGESGMCPLLQECHGAKEKPQVPLSDNAQVVRILEQLAAIQADVLAIGGTAPHLEEARRSLQEELDAAFDRMGVDLCAVETRNFGQVSAKRSRVSGRRTYNVKAAIMCGVTTDDAMRPFAKQGQGHSRWTVRVEALEREALNGAE